MTTLDRMFFANFVRNFAIVLVCMLSLYLVVDLFMNLNDFTKNKSKPEHVLAHIGDFYFAQVAVIYDRLAELITLAAAVFTVAWMQRNNELLPQLSAGVPTRRVIRPVLLGAVLATCLAPLNTEFYIPFVAEQLNVPRDESKWNNVPRDESKWSKEKQATPTKELPVRGAFDQNGDFIDGKSARRPLARGADTGPADRPYGRLTEFEYTSAAERGVQLCHLTATEADYIPPGAAGEQQSGGWKLYSARPELPPTNPDGVVTLPPNVTPLGPGQYFVKTGELDYDTVVRGRARDSYSSTPDVWDQLNRDTSPKQKLAVTFHHRIVRPLNGLILTLFGLAVILRNPNRHVFISAGLCLVLAVLFSAVVFGAKYLGEYGLNLDLWVWKLSFSLPPAVAAWMPALVFGPICFVTFDAIHT